MKVQSKLEYALELLQEVELLIADCAGEDTREQLCEVIQSVEVEIEMENELEE